MLNEIRVKRLGGFRGQVQTSRARPMMNRNRGIELGDAWNASFRCETFWHVQTGSHGYVVHISRSLFPRQFSPREHITILRFGEHSERYVEGYDFQDTI